VRAGPASAARAPLPLLHAASAARPAASGCDGHA